MPYSRRNSRSNLRPIHSIKHVVDLQGGNIGDTPSTVNLVATVDAPVVTNPTEVETGSRVNSLFLNVQVLSTAQTVLNNLYFMIYKNAGNNIPLSNIPEANKVGSSDFKTKVFHQEMSMLSDAADSIPITMFKGVLKIPRHMQRMGINDRIDLQIFTETVSNTQDFCIQSIYKEYR